METVANRRKRRWLTGTLVLAVLGISLGLVGESPWNQTARAEDKKVDVLCTFFPMYLFTKGVVGDSPNVSVGLMLPAEMGCPHDYDLTPSDIKRIARANVFVMNGAGLEEFTAKQVNRVNPKMMVIDSSKGIDKKSLIKFDNHQKASKGEKHGHSHSHSHSHSHAHHHHHAGGANPHFFSDPSLAAKQVLYIGESLAKADPSNAATYRKNAAAYAAQLEALSKQMKEVCAGLKNKKIVAMHEIFDYLARDNGLEIVATVFSAPGHDPSVGQMREIIQKIRKAGAAAVFTEPQYSARVAKTIAKEAGVPVASLDPLASGPEDASSDYYLKKMGENLETLKKTLGK